MRLKILLFLFIGIAAYADDVAIRIPGAKKSSKGDELVLLPSANTIEPTEFLVIFRKARSKQLIGGDSKVHFGAHFTRDDLPIKTVFWSLTGEYVAFDLRSERHHTETLIYRVAGQLSEVPVPEYWDQLKKQLGITAEYRGGQQIPIKWIDKNHLEIKESGVLADDTEFDSRVTLELFGTTAKFVSAKRQ